MIERTHTPRAPWTLVSAEDKYHARIEVLRTVCARLEEAVKSRARAGSKKHGRSN